MVDTIYTMQTAIQAIIDYCKENEEVFNDLIEELDNCEGYLGDDRYYPMEYLNEFYAGASPLDLLQRVFYGHDETYGDSESEFNPNRDYFRYNGYGNLVSSDYRDYSDRLDEYFTEEVINRACDLNLPDELQDIIDNIED